MKEGCMIELSLKDFEFFRVNGEITPSAPDKTLKS